MALTTSSQFSVLGIVASSINFWHYTIHYATTDNDSGEIRLRGKYPASGSDDYDALDILQQIYGTSDGFLNSDDESITITIEQSPLGDDLTIEEHEEQGSWNPFRAGSWEDFVASNQIRSALGIDGGFSRDETLGTPIIEFAGRITQTGRTPNTATYPYPLEDWTLVHLGENVLRFILDIDESEEITALDTYSPLIAFAYWLTSITSDSDVGVFLGAPASYQNRDFVLVQDTGQSSMTFTYTEIVTEQPGTYYTQMRITFTRQSGAVVDAPAIRDILQSDTIDIPTTENIERGIIGSNSHDMHVRSLRLGQHSRLNAMNVPSIGTRDEFNRFYDLPLIGKYGKQIGYSRLADQSGGGKKIADFSHHDTFHFEASQTADGRIRMPVPEDLLFFEDTDSELTFHNRNATYNYRIDDWDGNQLIILRPTERATFQISTESGDEGGEIVSVHVPDRKYRYHDTTVFGGSSPDFDDVVNWTDGSARIRMPIYDGDEVNLIHTDAFHVFTAIPGTLGQGDIDDATNFEFAGAVRMERSGPVHIDWTMTLALLSSATGTVGSGWAIRMYRIPHDATDGSDAEIIIEDTSPGIAVGVRRTAAVNTDEELIEGDILLPVLVYNSSSTSADNDEIRLFDNRLNLTFSPFIEVEYEL